MIKSLSVLGVQAALLVSVTLSVAQVVAHAGVYQELSAADQAKVQSGGQVMVTRDHAGSPWPEVTIYQRITSTPEEAMAVFADFELQKSYIPNLLKSHIAKRASKNTFDVDYTLSIPVVRDEDYTMRDVVSTYEGGTFYKMDWTLVKADKTKSTVGGIKFETLGTGTIMRYNNFVVPGQALAGMVKEKAMQQVKDTANAVVKQIQKERTSQQELLQRQITVLREML